MITYRAIAASKKHITSPRRPIGVPWVGEPGLFEIQENGNLDDKGNDRINEGKFSLTYAGLVRRSDNADYRAAYASSLIEFDEIPMAVRELRKLGT